jgi:hypothetical protein
MMATTRIAPSRNAALRFSIETVMKSAWRKASVSMRMPSGSARSRSAMTVSSRAVSSSVLTPGCFWMPSTTALASL